MQRHLGDTTVVGKEPGSVAGTAPTVGNEVTAVGPTPVDGDGLKTVAVAVRLSHQSR